MSTRNFQDNFVAYIAAMVTIGLIVMGASFWYQLRGNSAATPPMAYTKFGPYEVQVQNSTISASISLETDPDDVDWVRQNRASLDVIFQSVLAKADPQRLGGEYTIEMMQDALLDAANQDLHTNNLKIAVILTDFLLLPRPDEPNR